MAVTKQVPHLRWSQAPPLPWPRQGRRIFTACSITVLPELTIIIPKAVTVGLQSLCLGVVRRFLSALKTGTEPWNLQLGCKGGLVPTSSANLVGWFVYSSQTACWKTLRPQLAGKLPICGWFSHLKPPFLSISRGFPKPWIQDVDLGPFTLQIETWLPGGRCFHPGNQEEDRDFGFHQKLMIWVGNMWISPCKIEASTRSDAGGWQFAGRRCGSFFFFWAMGHGHLRIPSNGLTWTWPAVTCASFGADFVIGLLILVVIIPMFVDITIFIYLKSNLSAWGMVFSVNLSLCCWL